MDVLIYLLNLKKCHREISQIQRFEVNVGIISFRDKVVEIALDQDPGSREIMRNET